MASNNNTNSNRIVVPAARQALDQMKLEIANELGMANYDSLDKGNLPSRQNGYVGGYMTKRLVEMAQQNMAGGAATQNFTTPNNQ
ncbi:MAG: alpha/beta-type small acid-soluble spore protein [Tissierellia bacterium]|nr:alpha/beta-type small acid-soluble spore protein [Tissierellia bacterium]